MQIDATPIDATTGRSSCSTSAAKPGADPKTTGAADKTSRPLDPAIHIDPALGIAITQYFNTDGDVSAQYPTQQAIANYQIYGLSQTAPN